MRGTGEPLISTQHALAETALEPKKRPRTHPHVRILGQLGKGCLPAPSLGAGDPDRHGRTGEVTPTLAPGGLQGPGGGGQAQPAAAVTLAHIKGPRAWCRDTAYIPPGHHPL